MQKFLYQVAQSVIKNYPDNIGDLCIVFPNKRAGIFFRKYLSEIVKRNIQSPHITTINEFIIELSSATSGLYLADELTLISELYSVYKTKFTNPPLTENFDQFYPWGKIILSDFDEIDKYLIPAEIIFKNIEELKRIENLFEILTEEQIEFIKSFWKSFSVRGGEEKSKHKEHFLAIWSALYGIYSEFKNNLKNQNLAYEGMIYRDVIEKIKADKLIISYEKVIFCGFNSLTKCEEKLFEYLQKINKSAFYWDADKYYLDDKIQEAGFFIRKNIRKFHQHQDVITQNSELKTPKLIKIFGVSLEVGQAKLVGQILQNNNFNSENTVIVLPDEHLLPTVLHSIPENIQKINITMGYPLSNTPICSLIEHIIDLHKNKQKNKQNETTFYYRDVLAILRHQFCIILNNEQVADEIIQDIEKHNKIYIPVSYFSDIETEIYKNIFIDITEVTPFLDYLLNIILVIDGYFTKNQSISVGNAVSKTKEKTNTKDFITEEKSAIKQIYLEINRLKEIIIKQNISIPLEAGWRLITQIIKSVSIPFAGEPLEGLQIMGVLETRCLDFENVFMLSMNEGIFPKENLTNSFIPYNIRKGFGLPVYEHNDALYAYNFYRLIQRAKNIHLFYNTENTGNYSGEMSRFLYQLKYETPFNIEEYVLANNISIRQFEKISIPKTPDILNKLQNLYLIQNTEKIQNLKSLSTSAINSYIDCGLQFYFRYIANLEEPKKIKEEIDEGDFGSLFHGSVKILYSTLPHRRTSDNKIVEKSNLERLKSDVENSIETAFKELYNFPLNKPFEFIGRNIIIKEVIKKYILGLLEIDEQYAPFEIISLEEKDKYKMAMEISVNGKSEKVYISGVIDRIDKKDNIIRIIDYKTGRPTESKNIPINTLFERNKSNRNKDAFQILLYCILFSETSVHRTFDNHYQIIPHLFYTRKLYNDSETGLISLSTDYKNEFIENLRVCLEEIFDKTIDFKQTENSEICRYCAFRIICSKN